MAPEDNVLIVPVSRLRLPTLLLILELPPQDAYCFQVECDEWGGAESRGNGARSVE